MFSRWLIAAVIVMFFLQGGPWTASAQNKMAAGGGGGRVSGGGAVMGGGGGGGVFRSGADARINRASTGTLTPSAFGRARSDRFMGDRRFRDSVVVAPALSGAWWSGYYPSGYDYDPWLENNPYLTWRIQRAIAQQVMSGGGLDSSASYNDSGFGQPAPSPALEQARALNELEASPVYREVLTQYEQTQATYDSAQVRAMDKLRSNPDYQALVKERDRMQADIDAMQAVQREPDPAALTPIAQQKLDINTRITRMEQQAIESDPQSIAARNKLIEFSERLAGMRYQAMIAATQKPRTPSAATPEQPSALERSASPDRGTSPGPSTNPAAVTPSRDR